MSVLRALLVCMQCLAIAACGWAIGLTMERYAGRRDAGARAMVTYLAVAIIANTAILALVSSLPA